MTEPDRAVAVLAALLLAGGPSAVRAAATVAAAAPDAKAALAAPAAAPAPAKGAAASPVSAAKPEVASSTAAAKEPTVADIYQGDKIRDPFLEGGGGSAGGGSDKAASSGVGISLVAAGEFTIHVLQLRGVMEDGHGGYAVLVEPASGATFVLRAGRLFDGKDKPVKGIRGSVNVRQKRVSLMNAEKEKRELVLGEDKDEEDGR